MPISFDNQAWRRLDPGFEAPTFNPPLQTLRQFAGRDNVIFLHVGKCAGESIIRAMAQGFGTHVTCFEYHSFDANQVIRDLLMADEILERGRRLVFLVATRDPINRWFSAFNWDLHDLVLSKGDSLDGSLRRFPRASDLALGIARGDAEALRLARTNHMGMGLSWYLPLDLLPRLAGHRIYEIRQEHADQDFARFIDDFRSFTGTSLRRSISHWLRHRRLRPRLPRSKDQYKAMYAPGTFASPGECDPQTLSCLRDFLEADYAVNLGLRRLIQHQRRGLGRPERTGPVEGNDLVEISSWIHAAGGRSSVTPPPASRPAA